MKLHHLSQLLGLLSLCLPFFSAAQTTYTIGGISPDFTTFNEAVQFLETQTLTETVTFNVRDGVYEENVVLPEIEGASEANQIIFQGESGDRNVVTLEADLNGNNDAIRAVFRLDGADWVTLRHLSFKSLNIIGQYDDMSVLELGNEAMNCTIDQCKFEAEYDTRYFETTENIYLSQSFSTENYFTIISNSDILNGANGITVEGWGGNLQILNNVLQDQANAGISIYGLNDILIEGNTISTRYEGCNLYSISGNAIVNANTIKSLFDNGIHMGLRGAAIIQNNYIEVPASSGNSSGIYSQHAEGFKIYNNTINVFSNDPNTYAIYNHNVEDFTVKNNLLSHFGGGKLIKHSFARLFDNNHNNFFTEGDIIIETNRGDFTLSEFQTANNQELHSLAIDPVFEIDGYTPTASPLIGAGEIIPEITTDLLSNNRDVPPCIGAIEFTPPPYDIGIIDIITPAVPFAVGNYMIGIEVRNYGSETLTNFQVNWQVNNTLQSPYNWTGNLAAGETIIVEIGNLNFTTGTYYDFVTEVVLPNSQTDDYLFNNDLARENVLAGLGGTYTVGDANADFSDLETALLIVQEGGAVGAVTFDLLTGIYSGAFELSAFPGMGADNPVTIESQTGNRADVILSYQNNIGNTLPSFRLEKVSNFILKDLTIDRRNDFAHQVVAVIASSHLIFDNLVVLSNLDNSSNFQIFSGTNYLPASNITISNTTINSGKKGVAIDGNYSKIEHINLLGNEMNIEENAIDIEDVEHINILDNEINIAPDFLPNLRAYQNHIPISLKDCLGAIRIEKNEVKSFDKAPLLASASTAMTHFTVVNNFFTITSDEQYEGKAGVTIQGGILDFWHNTITTNLIDSDQGALNLQIAEAASVLNNIIVANGVEKAIHIMGVGSNYNLDYNNLFHNGIVLGSINNSTAIDLSEWQTLTGQSTNSISIAPNFSSSNSYQTNDFRLNAKATPITAVTTDIEGNLRDSQTPDIGALEFMPDNNDAGIIAIIPPTAPFAAGNQRVKVMLKNFGLNNLQSVDIQYAINGQMQAVFPWTGNLIPNGVIEISLPDLAFQEKIENTIEASISNPNGQTDEYPLNDAMVKDKIYAALNGVYSLGTPTSDFENFATVSNILTRGGVIGPTTFNIASGTYDEVVRIDNVLGTSATNTVTFQSAMQDNSQVIFDNPTVTYQHLFYISESNYVRLRYLRFITYESTRALSIQGENNIVEYCHFEAEATSFSQILITGNEEKVSKENIIRNSKIIGGEMGILVLGYRSNLIENTNEKVQILNNTIEDTVGPAIDIDRNGMPLIADNIILNCRRGIDLTNSTAVNIFRNQILNTNNNSVNYGILINTFGTEKSYITNNYLDFVPTSSFSDAIKIGGRSELYVLHNTIRLRAIIGNNVSVSAMNAIELSNDQATVVIKNNIISSESTNLVELSYMNSNYKPIDLNHNAYYSNHDVLFKVTEDRDYQDFSSLRDWKAATDYDQNSQTIEPHYGDLIAYQVENQLLRVVTDPTYTTLPEVGNDIENQVRPTDKAMAGVYEASPQAVDIAILTFPELEEDLIIGTETVSARVVNLGSTTVEALTIDWSVNGMPQSIVNWTGTLAAGATVDIELGVIELQIGQEYSITAHSSPAPLVDDFTENNEYTVNGIKGRLAGVYTVGGSNADFIDIQEAVETLQAIGVVGDVNFVIADGDYFVGITLDNFYNVGNYTIQFTAANGSNAMVILRRGNAPSPAQGILLRNVEHFEFHNITFINNLSYASALYILGRMDKLVVENCVFLVEDEGANTDNDAVLLNGGIVNNLIVKNSVFENGAKGIQLVGTSGNLCQITGNLFKNQTQRGLEIREYESGVVTNNKFEKNDVSDLYLYIALSLTRLVNTQISENQFDIDAKAGTGIMFYNNYSNTLVANNFIHINGVNATGIFSSANNNSDVHILYNTVNGSHEQSYQAIFNYGPHKTIGNIFHNYGTGLAFKYDYNVDDLEIIDYNNYFTNGNILVETSEGTYSDLAAWQAAEPLINQNSISVKSNFEPANSYYFTNESINNLVPFDNIVPTDIEGNTRPTDFTDAGCYELDCSLFDAPTSATSLAITCPTSYEIGFTNEQASDLNANDLVLSANNGCTAPEDLNLSFSETTSISSMPLNCGSINDPNFQIYATDTQGNQASCTVQLTLPDDQLDYCDCTHTTADIGGNSSNWETTRYRVEQTVTSNTTIANTEHLELYGGESVTLTAGFIVEEGGTFIAGTQGCNDGMNIKEIEEREEKKEVSNELSLMIAPNPVVDNSQVIFTLPNTEQVSLSVLNAIGKKLIEPIQKQLYSTGEHQINLNTSDFSAGLYYVQLQVGRSIQTTKLIVIKN